MGRREGERGKGMGKGRTKGDEREVEFPHIFNSTLTTEPHFQQESLANAKVSARQP